MKRRSFCPLVVKGVGRSFSVICPSNDPNFNLFIIFTFNSYSLVSRRLHDIISVDGRYLFLKRFRVRFIPSGMTCVLFGLFYILFTTSGSSWRVVNMSSVTGPFVTVIRLITVQCEFRAAPRFPSFYGWTLFFFRTRFESVSFGPLFFPSTSVRFLLRHEVSFATISTIRFLYVLYRVAIRFIRMSIYRSETSSKTLQDAKVDVIVVPVLRVSDFRRLPRRASRVFVYGPLSRGDGRRVVICIIGATLCVSLGRPLYPHGVFLRVFRYHVATSICARAIKVITGN